MKFEQIIDAIDRLTEVSDRLIIGIAGPPASGKTTLAGKLNAYYNNSVLVPMDGFHLDNSRLDQMGLRHRKGAPETFDVEGFSSLLNDMRSARLPRPVPEFDRELDRVVDGGKCINASHKLIIVEGNYLLLQQPQWEGLHTVFDFTIFLSPDLKTVSQRITDRWKNLGFSEDQARSKLELNDLPNARLVMQSSHKADLTLDVVQY